MRLGDWLASGHVVEESTSPQEIADLLATVDRDLDDARVDGVSADRRFMTAYNAGLQLGTVVLRADGYRVASSKSGHHWRTIELLPDLLGCEYRDQADYLNACRTRRNKGEYDRVRVATEEDVAELLSEVAELKASILRWLCDAHPGLVPSPTAAPPSDGS